MPKVAVVGFRYGLFDNVLSAEVQSKQRRVVDDAAAVVDGIVPVELVLTVQSEEEAARAAAQLRAGDVDVIVAVPATAVPPAWVAAAVPTEKPVVLWDVTAGAPLPPTADQVVAHRDTATTGTIMSGSALFGTHRYVVVSSPIAAADQRALATAVAAAGTANELTRSTILRIGRSFPGYTSIPDRADSAEYAAVGATVVDVTPEQLVEHVGRHLRGPTPDAAERSRALDEAVRELCDETSADALAMNCHGPLVARADEIGVVGCLAATSCNRRSFPVACTADVPTAVLLRVVQHVAGPALYCEAYTSDDGNGSVLLANCGLGHPHLAEPSTWREVANQQYIGIHGRGQSIAMSVPEGAATFLSVRPGSSRWSLVAIEGAVTSNRLPCFGGAHAYFRPLRLTSREMIVAFAERGVIHHGALVLGHHTEPFHRLGHLLPFDVEIL